MHPAPTEKASPDAPPRPGRGVMPQLERLATAAPWPFQALALLLAVDAGLLAINLADHALGAPIKLVHFAFSLDGEANVPEWFSSSQFLVAGMAALVLAALASPGERPSRSFFVAAAMVLIFLSADETAQVHERLSIRFLGLGWMPRLPGGHGGWMLPYAVAGVALAAAGRRNLAAFWRRYRRESVFILAGAGLLAAGGLGVEIVTYGFVDGEPRGLAYFVQICAEESLEMSGASILLAGTLLSVRARLLA